MQGGRKNNPDSVSSENKTEIRGGFCPSKRCTDALKKDQHFQAPGGKPQKLGFPFSGKRVYWFLYIKGDYFHSPEKNPALSGFVFPAKRRSASFLKKTPVAGKQTPSSRFSGSKWRTESSRKETPRVESRCRILFLEPRLHQARLPRVAVAGFIGNN